MKVKELIERLEDLKVNLYHTDVYVVAENGALFSEETDRA